MYDSYTLTEMLLPLAIIIMMKRKSTNLFIYKDLRDQQIYVFGLLYIYGRCSLRIKVCICIKKIYTQ